MAYFNIPCVDVPDLLLAEAEDADYYKRLLENVRQIHFFIFSYRFVQSIHDITQYKRAFDKRCKLLMIHF